jgi:hypothetical protein
MHESDTWQAILDEGQVMAAKEFILIVGEEQFGSPAESVKEQLNVITDLPHLKRMVRRAATATSWQEILDTP